jgi:hypothetical protein
MKISVGLASFDPIPVAVFHERRADFVCIPIAIKSDQKYHRDRLAEIDEVRRYISQEAQKDSLLSVRSGAKQVTNADKLGMLSSGQTVSSILLRVKLPDDSSNLFTGAERIQTFVEGLNLTGKTELNTGHASLEVGSPESYREMLLGLIQEDMNRTLAALGGNGTLSISGLETPVLISQIDERNVGLYIKYQMKLKTAPR